ncbi:hypothetical protein JRC04_04690 [Mycolicibacterium sp. S2-37]|uniref:hypothetical protein n=1 Tax=Mycolicibacterium sp. S2-37 TaxID=2810297 RepID=UPI001A9462BC|nr:hypothetical protein [Mycolicibacterium sp. S2-37]MBO0676756.1 hypothetical protein [Mycolicibacterium sp. S2-37]
MVSISKRAKLVTAVTLPAALLMACEEAPDEDFDLYCVNDKNEVVDPDKCPQEGSSGGGMSGFFFMMLPMGSPSYGYGSRIPGDKGYQRVSTTDSAGRTKAGLPASGKIGGFGKGAPGARVSVSGGS